MMNSCKWCGHDTFGDEVYCSMYCKEAEEGFNHDEGPDCDYDEGALEEYLESIGDDDETTEESNP